jgi:hypothetical protein
VPAEQVVEGPLVPTPRPLDEIVVIGFGHAGGSVPVGPAAGPLTR